MNVDWSIALSRQARDYAVARLFEIVPPRAHKLAFKLQSMEILQ